MWINYHSIIRSLKLLRIINKKEKNYYWRYSEVDAFDNALIPAIYHYKKRIVGNKDCLTYP
jgi:hypothetical protein